MRRTSISGLEYQVDLRDIRAQSLDITLRLRASLPLIVAMPVWTPGAYRRRDWLRNITPLASQTSEGIPLRWRRASVATWRVELATDTTSQPALMTGRPTRTQQAPAPVALLLRYRVTAQELADDASHVDDTHAHLNGTSVFLLVPQLAQVEHRLGLRLPRGWRLASPLRGCTALPSAHCLLARNYDELVDAPIEAGRFRRYDLRVGGRAITVAHHDGRGRRLPARLPRDLARIIAVQNRWFGKLPYERYVIVLHTLPTHRFVALEHASGTSAVVPETVLSGKGEPYQLLLYVLAHEHFHVFNGKRVRSSAERRYDYLRPPRSRLLWWIEGVTDYFALRTLRAAGLWDRARYLAGLTHEIDRLRAAPERLHKSLSDVAYDAWLPSRDRSVQHVSYYGKGHLVALLLDLELRCGSAGRQTLRGIVGALDRAAERSGGILGVDRQALSRRVAQVGGAALTRELQRWIEQPGSLPLARTLACVGLQLRSVTLPGAAGPGFEAQRRGGELLVSAVHRRGPVARTLFVGDRIAAIDGHAPGGRWRQRLSDGRLHRLEVLRSSGARRQLRLRVSSRSRQVSVLTTTAARPAALALGQAWLAP